MPYLAGWLAVCRSVLFLLATCSSGNDERLGDSIISEKASNAFFNKLDNDDNGQLSIKEFKQFVEDTGGNSLDDSSEIQSAIANILISLDDNADKVVKKKDLAAFWTQQASLLSVKEVADWARHSMHMPDDVVEVFIANAVTGFDFPELIENEGELLETELGITRKNLKRRLLRGMLMRFTGMGKFPEVPSSFEARAVGCAEVKLSWDKLTTTGVYFPVHKYVVERFVPDSQGTYTSTDAAARWETVYTGTGLDAVDKVKVGESSDALTYRISSWNAIGRSEFVYATLAIYSELFECLANHKNRALPLDYLVGSHGGRIMTTPSVPRPWADSPLYYLLFIPFVFLGVMLGGYALIGTIGEENDWNISDEPSTMRLMLFKARRIVRKSSNKKIAVSNATTSPASAVEAMSPPALTDKPVSIQSMDSTPGSSYSGNSSDTTRADGSIAGLDMAGEQRKKPSNWAVLRARIKSKQFAKVFGTGRSGAPLALPSTGESISDGIATVRRVASSTSGQEFCPEDIFNDDTGANDNSKPVSIKASSSSAYLPPTAVISTSPAMLPRAGSFGDDLDGVEKKDDAPKNVGISSFFKTNKSPSSGSCDNLPQLADHQSLNGGRVSPGGRESPTQRDICLRCSKSYGFGKRKKHRCGICNENFCGECGKVAHIFALPCKVPSQCICYKCRSKS